MLDNIIKKFKNSGARVFLDFIFLDKKIKLFFFRIKSLNNPLLKYSSNMIVFL